MMVSSLQQIFSFLFSQYQSANNPFCVLQAHITCDSEPGSVGSNGFIITRTNFVTLRYHTDSWGTNTNGFTLIITAFKNSQSLGCSSGFQCGSNICISPDLVCDNVSHCGHGEDETASNYCSGGWT